MRDAQAAGLIEPAEPAARARMLYAYSEGLLSQARIQDDANLLLELEQGMLDILRVKPTPTARIRGRKPAKSI